jgi:transposase, IS5 family
VPAIEAALIEVPTMRRFAGIVLITNRIPEKTTILTFRHLLEKNELLSARGMTMRQGTVVDATLIAAPRSTKNNGGKHDPEMHQTKKGNQWYHRYAEGFADGKKKVHIGVDKDSSQIQSVPPPPHGRQRA